MPNLDLIDLKRYETQRADMQTTKNWDDDSLEKLLEAQNIAKTKLKQIVRRGVPDGIRSIVWPEFLKMHKMPEYDKNYIKALFRVHGNKPPDAVHLCPLFGGSMFTEWMCLTPKGYLTAGRMLSILAYDYPHIEFCPFLPALVVLLLHHVGPDDTFGSMNWMIKSNLAKPDSWIYFPTYKRDIKALNFAFSQLVKTQLPKVWKQLELLNTTDKPLWARWFCDFLIGIFPIDVVFHILDSFVIEGYKVLLRYALALVELRTNLILSANSWDDIRSIFMLDPPIPSSLLMKPSSGGSIITSTTTDSNTQNLPSPISPPSPLKSTNVWKGSREFDLTKLFKLAFGYKFSKNKLMEFRNAHHESRSVHREGSLTDINTIGTTQFIQQPKLLHSEDSAFMTPDDWGMLWQWVPSRHKVAGLEMVFTTRKHGRTLNTFYDLCREREPTILLIETMDGSIFGAFCPVSWPLSNRDFQKFFGTGETFVFKLRSKGIITPIFYSWVHAHSTTATTNMTPDIAYSSSIPNNDINLIASNSTNSFMWAGNKELIIGGGGDGQAIWIEQNMTNGTTSTCTTFNNEPLCLSGSFEISVLEVYSFRL